MPFVLLRLFFRSLKEPDYLSALSQRFGFFRSKNKGKVVWIHAVSAGETTAAVPLIRRLCSQGYACLVTNMTPTGKERVKALLPFEVETCFVPYDLPGSISRFLKNNRPKMLITIDTELWPNMIAGCERWGVPVILVNGRLSRKSEKGYRRIKPLILPMLDSTQMLMVQTLRHKSRFVSLGTDPAKVHVTGSIKFDAVIAEGYSDRLARNRILVNGRRILLGASTHDGEEAALLSLLPSLRELVPNVLLVLAPRHIHRCEGVGRVVRSSGHSYIKLSNAGVVESHDQVLLIDSMGELDAFYKLASLAFVGGSLVPKGGHNLLEAVRGETPIVMGNHLDNIEDIIQQFMDYKAINIVSDHRELQEVVMRLMSDDDEVVRLVSAAKEVMKSNEGALGKVEDLIIGAMENEKKSDPLKLR